LERSELDKAFNDVIKTISLDENLTPTQRAENIAFATAEYDKQKAELQKGGPRLFGDD
jgi:hypothetical protein